MSKRDIDFSKIEPKILTEEIYDSTFNCNKEDTMGLNDFYHREALDYQKERLGRTFVFIYEGNTVGFVTLSMNRIERLLIREREDRIPLAQSQYPATLIGRLAVCNHLRNMGIGTHICKWAIGHSIELSHKYIACRYVILQTDEKYKDWYEKKLGFKLYQVALNRKGEIDYWLYRKLE
jgi:predicted N-acetyltransferase YhbS